MNSPNKEMPLAAKIIALSISIIFIGLGGLHIAQEYVPASWNRYGYIAPIDGNDAKIFGVLEILIGLLPLMFFAKNARQAGIFGTIVGSILVSSIFLIWAFHKIGR
ncbi:hypothetical protein Syn7502_03156 [Synechococcus sp. PCC 7502]|uniref:hypothetical protein n=1 Tax=Synechococcus sp. PCC 7502 TaxID=1173263 RepID=UPI00029FF1C9|nr:hypothetical protein [Synechococcus sp. PCC 7502]AFY75045.1 hypothetical protein Syn7502_03156 [Synechococcus sp. PCC 7502]